MQDDILHALTVGDQEIDVAAIPVISLVKLTEGDTTEVGQLQRAASEIGFFYIDLRGCHNEALKKEGPLYAIAEKYFHQPQDAKLQDARHDIQPSQDFGYKYCECDETLEVRTCSLLFPSEPHHIATHSINKNHLLTHTSSSHSTSSTPTEPPSPQY